MQGVQKKNSFQMPTVTLDVIGQKQNCTVFTKQVSPLEKQTPSFANFLNMFSDATVTGNKTMSTGSWDIGASMNITFSSMVEEDLQQYQNANVLAIQTEMIKNAQKKRDREGMVAAPGSCNGHKTDKAALSKEIPPKMDVVHQSIKISTGEPVNMISGQNLSFGNDSKTDIMLNVTHVGGSEQKKRNIDKVDSPSENVPKISKTTNDVVDWSASSKFYVDEIPLYDARRRQLSLQVSESPLDKILKAAKMISEAKVDKREEVNGSKESIAEKKATDQVKMRNFQSLTNQVISKDVIVIDEDEEDVMEVEKPRSFQTEPKDALKDKNIKIDSIWVEHEPIPINKHVQVIKEDRSIATWLKSLKMSVIINNFEKAGIKTLGELLKIPNLQSFLEEIGIDKEIHRVLILEEVSSLGDQSKTIEEYLAENNWNYLTEPFKNMGIDDVQLVKHFGKKRIFSIVTKLGE